MSSSTLASFWAAAVLNSIKTVRVTRPLSKLSLNGIQYTSTCVPSTSSTTHCPRILSRKQPAKIRVANPTSHGPNQGPARRPRGRRPKGPGTNIYERCHRHSQTKGAEHLRKRENETDSGSNETTENPNKNEIVHADSIQEQDLWLELCGNLSKYYAVSRVHPQDMPCLCVYVPASAPTKATVHFCKVPRRASFYLGIVDFDKRTQGTAPHSSFTVSAMPPFLRLILQKSCFVQRSKVWTDIVLDPRR